MYVIIRKDFPNARRDSGKQWSNTSVKKSKIRNTFMCSFTTRERTFSTTWNLHHANWFGIKGVGDLRAPRPRVLLARYYKSTCFGPFLSPCCGTRPSRIKICSTREKGSYPPVSLRSISCKRFTKDTSSTSYEPRQKCIINEFQVNDTRNCSFGELFDPTI